MLVKKYQIIAEKSLLLECAPYLVVIWDKINKMRK